MERSKKAGGAPAFLLAYLVYAMVYVCRSGIAMVKTELNLAGGEYSVIVAALLTAYAVGRLVNGALGDRVPASVMVGAGILSAGVSNILFGLFYPLGVFPLLCVLWAGNGFAESMIWGPLLDTVYRRCGRRKIVTALFGSSIGAGSVLAVVATGAVAQAFGVPFAFYVPGAVSVAAGILALIFFRPRREDAAAPATPKPAFSFRSLFRFRQIGWMLLPAVLHGVFKDNINNYAPGFFAEHFGVEVTELWYFVFVIPVLTLAGRLLHPLLYRLFREDDDRVLLFGFGLCAVSSVPLCFDFGGVAVSAACLAVFAAAISVINATLLTMFPLRFADEGCVSSVSGTMDFVVYLTGAAASLAYGAVEKAVGSAGMYRGMYASWFVCCVCGVAFAVVSRIRHRK